MSCSGARPVGCLPARARCRAASGPPRAQGRPDRALAGASDGWDAPGLLRAAAAAAAVLALAECATARAARAADAGEWKPRRHHRHIGERFTDTWADAVVEVRWGGGRRRGGGRGRARGSQWRPRAAAARPRCVPHPPHPPLSRQAQEADREVIRDLTRQLAEQRQRADVRGGPRAAGRALRAACGALKGRRSLTRRACAPPSTTAGRDVKGARRGAQGARGGAAAGAARAAVPA